MIEKPIVVVDYNVNMDGVDLVDSGLHFYSSNHNRLKKYYMKMLTQFLFVEKKQRVSFILDMGDSIVETYADIINISVRRLKTLQPSLLVERHFPAIVSPTTTEMYLKEELRTTIRTYKNTPDIAVDTIEVDYIQHLAS